MKWSILMLSLVLCMTGFGLCEEKWQNAGLQGTSVTSLAVLGQEMYAGTGKGVFFSHDAATWHLTSMHEEVTSLALTPQGHLFAATVSQGIGFSKDRGKTWSFEKISEKPVSCVAVNARGHVFAGTSCGKIFRSMDHGATWVPVFATELSVSALFVGEREMVYATALSDKQDLRGALYHSKNNGESWESVPFPGMEIYGGVVVKEGTLLATDKGIYRLVHGEGSFVNQGLREKPAFVANFNGCILAGGHRGLYRFIQEKWILVTPPFDVHCVAHDGKGTVFVGTENGVLKHRTSLEQEYEMTLQREAGRIEIRSWDVGGGNYLYPSAKILVGTYGSNCQKIILYGVSSEGYLKELQLIYCSHGGDAYFKTTYYRPGTRWLELRLYDNMGYVIAREIRSAY